MYACILYIDEYNFYTMLCVIDINVLVSGDRGPCSKYDISIEKGDFKGELEIVWDSDPLRVSTGLWHYVVSTY